MNPDKYTLDFFAECGMLKRVKRSGWWMAGIPYDESVAEHSFRCAVIGYALAKIEGCDPYKVLLMTLFNDLHEARLTDMHKVAQRYINTKDAERKAFLEQVAFLGNGMNKELSKIKSEYDSQENAESVIARDADILECLIQAKDYSDLGLSGAKKFFKSAPKYLVSKSAKSLWKNAKTWDSGAWWEKLGRFTR